MRNGRDEPGNANLPIGGFNRKNEQQRRITGPDPMWQSRGYLPHFESSGATQHVTFHLADSLPQSALTRMEIELSSVPAIHRDAERRRKVEEWIDAGHGSCVLRNPSIAQIAQTSLLRFDGQRYLLIAWVVMPNHIHVLFQPIEEWTVAKIVGSWKKFLARQIRDVARNAGQQPNIVWHREYWDRFIRDRGHLLKAIDYIHANPVKAGLVDVPEKRPWSSAHMGH